MTVNGWHCATLSLIEPPDAEIVSLEEAKAQLRITDADQDDMIKALVDAAVAQIDPGGGGWLGRALGPQTWEMQAAGFPCYYSNCAWTRTYSGTIELPYPPHISVDSVKYYDGNGVDTTLVEGVGYRVLGLGSTRKVSIAPVYNGSWPSSVRYDPGSVRIRFTSGYEDGVPSPIKQAVILMVRHLYGLGERNLFVSSENVDGVGSQNFVVSEVAATVMRGASEGLLAPYRVWE